MYSLLSLGDSYTIGEGVPLADSYPYQTVQLLRRNGHAFYAPEIVARTGWTTGELAAAMDRTLLLPHYDLATLLIGVNNQYRGWNIDQYATQFEDLLGRAGRLASGRVIVLSIPDWGVSPFAASTNRAPADIAREIDAFNTIAAGITRRHRLPFIDITPHSRTSPVFTTDGLHPAAETYAYWAQQLAANIPATLS
ncbi:MAG TPA: SGNH/GDSL hydrolase family protein [Puia sp.]|jgi:lysophospholipase L1-like esterase|nr:SGNH/GDSL hydrolase family protein [Puia sp.]